MKAHFKNRTGRLVVEVEGANVKELFERIAEVQEILDADSNCGACGSEHIKFRVRHAESFVYYELHCEQCNAALAFGQRKNGIELFPKRKDDDQELENRGWRRYLPKKETK